MSDREFFAMCAAVIAALLAIAFAPDYDQPPRREDEGGYDDEISL